MSSVRSVSSYNSSRNGNKPFCKVCYDAGKSEAEYTSHYVRSSPNKNSEVVCPTLLGQACRFCGNLGHTVSKCAAARDYEKVKRTIEYQDKKIYTESKKIQTPKNKFGALEVESDDEEEDVEEDKAFPPLAPVCVSNNDWNEIKEKKTTSWASIAAKEPKQQVNVDENSTIKWENLSKMDSPKHIVDQKKELIYSRQTSTYNLEDVPIAKAPILKGCIRGMSWAEMSMMSDDEDD